MWSSHLIAFTAATCAVAMSASAVAEARCFDDSDHTWFLPVAVVITSGTGAGSGAHRLADGHGQKSMARDYARTLEAFSRAMQQTTRRRRRLPKP
jgi:NhaP-type Na+/H+ or K+/H+ antiporter